MPTPTTREELFEYRARGIFKTLRREYKEHESNEPFEDWLGDNLAIVGGLFLDDVESYMGFPEEEGK